MEYWKSVYWIKEDQGATSGIKGGKKIYEYVDELLATDRKFMASSDLQSARELLKRYVAYSLRE